MKNIFFTSDTHFCHNNIIKYCDRPFSDVDEMDDVMIDRWNSAISKSDTVYHLGDFAFGTVTKMGRIMNRLNGNKILIKGNHDNYKNMKKLSWSSIHDVKEVSVGDQKIFLSHYPHRAWNNSYRGVWHLYGHVHGNLEGIGKSFDIGVDIWDFSPVHFDQVKEKMDNMEEYCPDLP